MRAKGQTPEIPFTFFIQFRLPRLLSRGNRRAEAEYLNGYGQAKMLHCVRHLSYAGFRWRTFGARVAALLAQLKLAITVISKIYTA